AERHPEFPALPWLLDPVEALERPLGRAHLGRLLLRALDPRPARGAVVVLGPPLLGPDPLLGPGALRPHPVEEAVPLRLAPPLRPPGTGRLPAGALRRSSRPGTRWPGDRRRRPPPRARRPGRGRRGRARRPRGRRGATPGSARAGRARRSPGCSSARRAAGRP